MTAQTSEQELLALAEALWLYEASDMPAARNARSCQVFTDQSESTQKKWTGFASAALAHLAATRAAEDTPVAWRVTHFDDDMNEVEAQVFLDYPSAHKASAESDCDTVTEPLVLAVTRPNHCAPTAALSEEPS